MPGAGPESAGGHRIRAVHCGGTTPMGGSPKLDRRDRTAPDYAARENSGRLSYVAPKLTAPAPEAHHPGRSERA